MKNRSGKTGVPKDIKRFHKGRVTGQNERRRLIQNTRVGERKPDEKGPEK